jgi:hypothetical protein
MRTMEAGERGRQRQAAEHQEEAGERQERGDCDGGDVFFLDASHD